MYTLTPEQKISNLEELLEQKKKKISNLQKEVDGIEKKLLILRTKPTKDNKII